MHFVIGALGGCGYVYFVTSGDSARQHHRSKQWLSLLLLEGTAAFFSVLTVQRGGLVA
jgi:hypothetical protein